ncbi:RING/U-box superfamily protein [Actinidia rufa]|uniref:RING/U-box superfamily protein n=1 Tax=Actinidia rufa TaxID=165716 RepID=A0A7J0EW09_9ERIC|nr:RING/U-box superfamily protein [Actinidia rufa]
MSLEDCDLLDDGDGAGGGKSSYVSCSICLEAVADNGDRSWAKLQCSHQFHLDCIGSAFNTKGAMQCPNCRKIEKGQWLYASGCHPVSEFNMDDWAHDEDLYDLSYSEMVVYDASFKVLEVSVNVTLSIMGRGGVGSWRSSLDEPFFLASKPHVLFDPNRGCLGVTEWSEETWAKHYKRVHQLYFAFNLGLCSKKYPDSSTCVMEATVGGSTWLYGCSGNANMRTGAHGRGAHRWHLAWVSGCSSMEHCVRLWASLGNKTCLLRHNCEAPWRAVGLSVTLDHLLVPVFLCLLAEYIPGVVPCIRLDEEGEKVLDVSLTEVG